MSLNGDVVLQAIKIVVTSIPHVRGWMDGWMDEWTSGTDYNIPDFFKKREYSNGVPFPNQPNLISQYVMKTVQ